MEKKWIYGRRRRRRRDQTRPDGLGALLPPRLMGGGGTVRVWTKRSGAGLGARDGRREMGTGCGVWMCGCVDVWMCGLTHTSFAKSASIHAQMGKDYYGL